VNGDHAKDNRQNKYQQNPQKGIHPCSDPLP
jgi:hypothetical protein